MEEEYRNELEENINTTKGELTEKVDTYLNYVVEEWMKENELAIERGPQRVKSQRTLFLV